MAEATNQTLGLLVRSWANRLEREIEIVVESLPDDMPRHENSKVYVGPRGFLNSISSEDKAKPENWEEREGSYRCLDGLYDMLDELREAERKLNEEGGDA